MDGQVGITANETAIAVPAFDLLYQVVWAMTFPVLRLRDGHVSLGDLMFGYIGIDKKALTREETDRYRSAYCGLCRILGEQFGGIGRFSLTYDMTFVSLLLSSLYDLEDTAGRQRCIPHPLRSHPYAVNATTRYAADMSIILAYYQALDDFYDDHNTMAGKKSKSLERFLPEVIHRRPRQCGVIKDSLEQLSRIEHSGELNPDIPTNCFGWILGEVFAWQEDEYADILRSMGAALGRFIYLLDASNDLILTSN